MRTCLSRYWQRGVAAIEAAILLVPLVVLATGIVEGGRAVYQYNTIAKATRDAARYLTTVAPGPGPGDVHYATARCLAAFGNPTCAPPALVEGLEADNVGICDAVTCPATHRNVPANGNGGAVTGVMNLVTVTVSGYHFVHYLVIPLPTVEFDPISTTMRQAL